MLKAAVKEKIEQPWFGTFTPADPSAPPLLIPVEPKAFPMPEAVSSVPQTGPGGGVSYDGFLYGLVQSVDTALGGIGTAGNVTLTKAPDASANYGVLSVGDGGFTGDVGGYAGGSGGSLVAVNLASGGTADVLNLQIAGVSKCKLGSGGNITLGEGVNFVLGQTTGTKIGSTSAAKIGLWGATPIAQQAGTTDLRTGLIAAGIFNSTGAMPLNLNGGDLTVNQGFFSGALQGSGTALQLKRLSFTFASDANETLDVTGKANVIIDIQTGVISTQRDLLVSGNAGAFYIIINRNANAVNVRVGANAGIVVAATRSRILCFPGGTTAFALTPDVNYAV